jgi:hypothetical protein
MLGTIVRRCCGHRVRVRAFVYGALSFARWCVTVCACVHVIYLCSFRMPESCALKFAAYGSIHLEVGCHHWQVFYCKFSRRGAFSLANSKVGYLKMSKLSFVRLEAVG